MRFSKVQHEILKTLAKHRIKPRKLLGQHFLVNENTIKKIMDIADVKGDEIVVEFGSGLGSLTRYLCEYAGLVIAIELDEKLAKVLKSILVERENLEIIIADARCFKIRKVDKVVSSPPYNISTKIVEWLVLERPKYAILILQDDFVKRLLSKPSQKDYSYISFIVQATADAKKIFEIPQEDFKPKPHVKSALLKISFDKNFDMDFLRFAIDIGRSLFVEKNKLLKHSLQLYFAKRGMVLDLKDIPCIDSRPVTMLPEKLLEVLEIIYRMMHKYSFKS